MSTTAQTKLCIIARVLFVFFCIDIDHTGRGKDGVVVGKERSIDVYITSTVSDILWYTIIIIIVRWRRSTFSGFYLSPNLARAYVAVISYIYNPTLQAALSFMPSFCPQKVKKKQQKVALG